MRGSSGLEAEEYELNRVNMGINVAVLEFSLSIANGIPAAGPMKARLLVLRSLCLFN